MMKSLWGTDADCQTLKHYNFRMQLRECGCCRVGILSDNLKASAK